ncbi:MAG TPA: hypothetical protein VG992_00640 [Candidatus Saccharimonadales bacterium]|nr:hypothetical protein [Candidatus Saccharimonadales bacterium]
MTVPELGLKDQNEAQLLENLLVTPEWSPAAQDTIRNAYELASHLHATDKHGGKPYVYHLLRVANRVTGYLGIYDAELVMAALLHDSVEDHPVDILTATAHPNQPILVPHDPAELQTAALGQLARVFSSRTAEIVRAVTNPPNLDFSTAGYQTNLDRYHQKVVRAVATLPEAALLKFCDWNDNAMSLIHQADMLSPERIAHGQRKYGPLIPIFEQRFNEADMQARLSSDATAYINHQLFMAKERLILAA